ncbi:CVNH domain-containing protein [Phenylobacterium sp.]|uniref:CVNH domain-containing protein n=1 Tax=Phenylobacterium sp. TaxID=1871053 RepID=UPI00289D4901|nr:CVNH domain-containing protein [Phenylobacterium sp.]
MKSWIAAAAVAVTAFCSAAAHAQEQDQRWGGGGPGWGQLPSGSYQQTCRDPRVSGATLTASCQDSRGRWNYSSLNFRDCRGDIANNNGRLSCQWGGGGPGWGQLPSGSYQQTCRDARVSGNTLTASCRDGRGRWNYSTLNFRDCRSDIGNDNGRLVCGWSGGGGGPPWSGGQSTLMLYSSPNFSGQAYQAAREVTNLPRQFNDRAMSLRIQGRGAWQICSDSDFRGRCQIFDRDVPDLRQYGLGEAVSSMRPMSGRPY